MYSRRTNSRLVLAAMIVVTIGLLAAACGDESDSDPVVLEPTSAERAAIDPAAPMTEVARAVNSVGWALWDDADLISPGENSVISPSSIGHALLMARGAADEATAAAIDAATGLPAGVAAHAGWNAIDLSMAAAADAEEKLTLALADRIWPRLDVTPDQGWVDLLARHHGVDIQTLDYAGDPDGSREIINDWVSNATQELIPNLLPPGFIGGNTTLVLTDALYFEAQWKRIFGKYGPKTGTFTRLDGSGVDVEFMRELELGSPRGSGDGYVGAEIPYVGDAFSMLVIVPEQGRFDEVRNRLGDGLLAEIDAGFTNGPFELLLPKWEDSTEQLDLMGWLRSIGAAPGLYPKITPGSFLDAAVHGADIAVDEMGTVAAAATGFGFAESGPPEPELTVAADTPFLYLIRHLDSGLVLFLGQVTDPTA